MKTKFLSLLAVVLCLGFAACSEDDESTSVGSEIAGSYSGYTSTTFAYISYAMGADGESAVITDAGNDQVNVTVVSATWGTYTFENAAVTLDGSTYTIAETAGSGEMTSHSSTNTYDATLTGTVANGSATLVVSIPSVMGGTVVTFYTGSAPAAVLAAGSYSGYTATTFVYISYYMTDVTGEKVLVVANEDGTANITCTFATWGDGTFENVAISGSNGSYTFAETTGTLAMAGHSGTTEYDAVFSGSIVDGALTATVYVASVMGGTTVSFGQGSIPASYVLPYSYSGAVSVTSAYFTSGYDYEEQSLAITSNGDGTYALSYTNDTWGTVTATISEASLSADSDAYEFSVEDALWEMSGHSGTSTYDATVEGSVSLDRGTVTITMTCPSVMGGTVATFTVQ